MDIISHALTGRLLVPKSANRRDKWSVCLFGALPDVFQLPLYAYLGVRNGRPLGIPLNEDWAGFRSSPLVAALWEIPHSILFLIAVVVPLVCILRLNRVLIGAYALHIGVDVFTHSGEWAVKPLYPLQVAFSGFTDAWMWPLYQWLLSWMALAILIILKNHLESLIARRRATIPSRNAPNESQDPHHHL